MSLIISIWTERDVSHLPNHPLRLWSLFVLLSLVRYFTLGELLIIISDVYQQYLTRLTQKGWSLFYIGCRRVVGRLRQSSASLHPPSGTSFLREPLTRPRPATLCRSLPATTQLTSLPVFQQQVPYFEPACAWTLLYKQHTS